MFIIFRPVDSSKPSGSTERPPPSISSVNQSVITTPANASINPPPQIMSAPVRPVVASTDRLGQSHDSSNGEAVSISSSPGAVQMTTNNNNGNTVTPCKVLTLPWRWEITLQNISQVFAIKILIYELLPDGHNLNWEKILMFGNLICFFMHSSVCPPIALSLMSMYIILSISSMGVILSLLCIFVIL